MRRNACKLEHYKDTLLNDSIEKPPSQLVDKSGRINYKDKKYHALGKDGLANVGAKLE
jgi:hypothetical protein